MKTQEKRAAFVTGGSRGIGAAIVKRLAKSGVQVAFTYFSAEDRARQLEQEIAQAGGHAVAIKADNGDVLEVETAVKSAVDQLGRLDILVNSAGVSVFSAVDDKEHPVSDLARLHSVNIAGAAAAVRAATQHMQQGGRIINIGSTFADRIPVAGFADYAASKAALAAYTRGWARDLGSKGITVNTVHPGPTATEMNPDNTDFAEHVKQTIALGRYATPDEIAAVVAFVASPDASFMTGSTITVDGGQNA